MRIFLSVYCSYVVFVAVVGFFIFNIPLPPSLLEQVREERIKNASEEEKRRQEYILEERQEALDRMSKGENGVLLVYRENEIFFRKEGFFLFPHCEYMWVLDNYKHYCFLEQWEVSVPDEPNE